MKTKILKSAGLVSFAIVFGLIPLFTISGTAHAENKEKDHVYCDENAKQLFVAKCAGDSPTLLNAPNSRYIDITMHVKEGEGHFEEGDAYTRTKTYYRGDSFDDNTEPVTDREGYAFVGWSTKEEATEVDVEIGDMSAATVGTDVWAVWSDKAYVAYYINGGVWDAPNGEIYSTVMMEYNVGDTFNPLDPEPRRIEHYYDFVGWTTEPFGKGEHYTPKTAITKGFVEVYSEWKYNPEKIEDEMILDEVYDVSAGVSIPLYTFTPEEDGWYEIYTNGFEADPSDDREVMLRLMDVGDRVLAIEQYIDPTTGGDAHIYYEMTAGETYYIRMGEMSGNYIRFDASIRKAETTTVTFDANHGADAWFVIDESQSTTKDATVPVGDNIASRRFEDFEIGDGSIVFSAWSTEPEGEIHSAIIVTGPMTVYAQYREMTVIPLDYNGGYNPFNRAETSQNARFNPYDQFETPVDPKHDSPELKFTGWSVDPNADEPDKEVIEGKNSAESLAKWLDGRTLYAVYSEPVSVTFKTTGGSWMMDDTNIATYESSVGKGHIFYGMAVMHYHPSVEHAGWVDQNGVFTAATSGIDATYHITEDSTFTSVLKYKMLAVGNGGRFPNGGIGGAEKLTLRLLYNGWQTTFSYDEALEILGEPISNDDSKHFVGFATNPNATEPDIIDGETLLEDLGYIYAIWSDEEEPEPEPEPEDEPAEESEAPEVPNTGANPTAENHTTAATYTGLGAVIALIAFAILHLLHKRRA